MNRDEFEERTGFFPSQSLYGIIEKYYTAFPGDKDEFCKAYKENEDGLAWKIQEEADSVDCNADREQSTEITRLSVQITQLAKELEHRKIKIARLEKELEQGQDWKPYESPNNVSQADYERLARGAENGNSCHYMTDDEAVQWICSEFDFVPEAVTVIHEVDEYEINCYRQLRRTGRKIDRRPVYCATDYHYIRFNTSRWYYEVWNGQLRPFYE